MDDLAPSQLVQRLSELGRVQGYWTRFRHPTTGASMPVPSVSIEHLPVNPPPSP